MKLTTKNEASKIKLLKLAKIVTDAGTQIRAKLDEFTVDEYALAMMDSTDKFPPVVVFHDGDRFILADGFHRHEAAIRNGFLDIEAEIHKGTQRDAFTFALGANVNHGLRRSNADKRNAVTLALDAWPDISDNQVAKLCGVSHPFVGIVRAQLVTVTSCDPAARRLGADNKYRKPPVKPDPEPTPAAADLKLEQGPSTKIASVCDEDENLIQDCIEVIRAEQKASICLLQRRLRLGYARADRIMGELENRGIVGPAKGAEPRDILIDLESSPKTPAERNDETLNAALGGTDAIKAALAKHQADTVHAFKVAVGKLIADLPKNIDTLELIGWLHGQANLLSNRRDQQKHMKAYTA